MLPCNDLTFISDLFLYIFFISFTFSVRLFNSLYLFWGLGLRMHISFFLDLVSLYVFWPYSWTCLN